MKTGGAWALRENVSTLSSRLLSFGNYNWDIQKYDVVNELFHEEDFEKISRSVCPADKPFLDPFQFNFIINAPGQTVATHIDGVYFWGATRFQYPQWLLSAMKFSGLFEERFVDQVQVVAYLHEWDPREVQTPGKFIYWGTRDGKSPQEVLPFPRAGVAVDGSKTVHAAMPYRIEGPAPVIDKDSHNELVYQEMISGFS